MRGLKYSDLTETKTSVTLAGGRLREVVAYERCQI